MKKNNQNRKKSKCFEQQRNLKFRQQHVYCKPNFFKKLAFLQCFVNISAKQTFSFNYLGQNYFIEKYTEFYQLLEAKISHLVTALGSGCSCSKLVLSFLRLKLSGGKKLAFMGGITVPGGGNPNWW